MQLSPAACTAASNFENADRPWRNDGGFCPSKVNSGMKENMLDVLMYLFQNGMDDDMDPDYEMIQTGLMAAGFPSHQIQQAFEWLDHLVDHQPALPPVSAHACRIYVAQELDKLDVECRGFLLFLERSGILAPETRELVIDRVMALETDEIDLRQLKWIILMVLFNQPGQEDACAWLEDLVFDDAPGGCLH